MSASIERALSDRFHGFGRALASGDLGQAQRLAAAARPKSAAWTGVADDLRQLALLAVASGDDARSVLSLASQRLPAPCWGHVVIAFDSASSCRGGQEHLRAMGFDLHRHAGGQDFLAELNMAAVASPPLPGMLHWLAELPGASLLADGDRGFRVAEPVAPPRVRLLGPLEAMHTVMTQGKPMPDDFRVVQTVNAPVLVAVLDSGMDRAHPGLAPVIAEHVDVTPGQLGPVDPVGHGTHVGYIVAGIPFGGDMRLSGVCPWAKLVDIQVVEEMMVNCLPYLDGIGYAIRRRVDVLNMSLRSYDPADGKSVYSQAIQRACELGIICCVSAGNDGEKGEGTVNPPADAPSAVCVASVDADGVWSKFSSCGPTDAPEYTGVKPTVAAPGEAIVSACSSTYRGRVPPVDPGGYYVPMWGTSMSSPIVAGVCALGLTYLRGKGVPRADAAAVVGRLVASAADLHHQGPLKVGAGVPQVPAFLRALGEMAGSPPPAGGALAPLQAYQALRPGSPAPVPPAATTVASAPTPPKRTLDDGLKARITRYREMERGFLHGVRANLEACAAGLVEETLGVRGASLGDVVEDSDRNRIEDAAVEAHPPPALLDAMPRNGEIWAVLRKGSRPALRFGAKSFAAWRALAQAGATVRSDIEFVSDYIRRRRDEAGPVPCVLSLFVPDTWAEDVRRVALELGVGRAYLCRPGRESGPQVWMELAPQAAGWHTWLAATPMSVPERVQWCLDRLDAHPEMRGRDNLMYERDLLAHLGMPEAVAHELLAQACAPKSSRFKHLRTRDGEFYVKRVEAR